MNKPPIQVTLEQAKACYIAAGGPQDHSDDEWFEIHLEMTAVINAKSDLAAARKITWWLCWNRHNTATAFCRRAREHFTKLFP